LVRAFEIQQRETDVLQIIAALHAAGRFAHRLNRRKQQTDEQAHNAEGREQFH
jgi:hypothetical protein